CSTRRRSELGTARYQDVLETHTRILRDAIKDGGVEVRVEGDALFVVFPVAVDAVRAAAAAQRALAKATFPHGATVRVRMGMHTGEGRPASAEAGADYVGIDVNRAARVAAAGHGGQVLITEATATLARANLGEGTSLRDLGEFRLKDLARPERIYQLVIVATPADSPRGAGEWLGAAAPAFDRSPQGQADAACARQLRADPSRGACRWAASRCERRTQSDRNEPGTLAHRRRAGVSGASSRGTGPAT